MTKKDIYFTKWLDALVDEEDNDKSFEDDEWNFVKKMIINKPPKNKNIYLSNLGIIPLNHNLASQQNKIWVGHTNFRLTANDKEKSIRTDGIEAWKCVTPYRFIISVGWMFKDEEVKLNLKKSLCEEPKKKEISDKFTEVFPYWASVKLKNGKKDFIGGKNQEEIKNKIASRQDIDIIVDKSWKDNAK